MDAHNLIRTLHPLEVKVLLAYGPEDELDAERLKRELGYRDGQDSQAFSWLVAKGFAAESSRIPRTIFEITQLGRDTERDGTPEERILAHLSSSGASRIPEIVAAVGLDQRTVGSAFGQLAKEGLLAMDVDKRAALVQGASLPARVRVLKGLLAAACSAPEGILEERELDHEQVGVMSAVAKKRGAQDAYFRLAEREQVSYRLLPESRTIKAELESQGVTGEELGEISQDILEKASWKTAVFRPYNIGVSAPRLIPGRHNPYVEFLESVKDKLVSLGFEEFDGSLVETEFWNSDALFMPQFHSARDIHDVYYVSEPSKAAFIEEPYLDSVSRTHEDGGNTESRGWSYRFDREFTKRLILRSQGTVLSARQLPKAQIPGKYFGIARCFRYDRVDATHLSDFYQTEGIVLGDEVNLRTLLGFLKMFAVEVAGAKEVKYVPGYFPFTEPSVEVHIKHPVLGWFELGGAGIFRPEVTEPLGVTVPVLAWGIGIDRMALMALGLNDLRELFSADLENVRMRRSLAAQK
jgi:phenylalanyl-tRNA synthetase alpha chain